MPPGEFGGSYINDLFTNSLDAGVHDYFREICHLKVSSHLLIDRQGVVTQYVSFDKRAWHAGASEFQGRMRFNDFSIGIELEGTDWLPYNACQYTRLAELILTLKKNYPQIKSSNLVGHSTISPGRKTDPGPAFDWWRLRGLLTAFGE